MDNTNPTVYHSPEASKPNKKWFQTWRIIYLLLGIVLLVELIFGAKTLLTPLPKASAQNVLPISDATIYLISPKNDFKVGDQIPVLLRVSTGGHFTTGADIVLLYDPKILEASQTAFLAGKIYDDYSNTVIDAKTGTIKLSGFISAGKKGYVGIGNFGMVNFKAKGVGKTTVKVGFRPGITYDSNIMASDENGKDVLGSVSNLDLTIK